MVPSDWERTSFGLLAEFRNGLNFTKADQGEAIKIVGVADFKDHSSLSNLDNLGVISVSNTVKDNDLIKSGDVLYVRSNGNKDLIGRCLFFPEVTEKLSFSGFTIRGRVTSKAILPNYLALLSRSEIVKQQFSKNGGGTNISNLSQQILSDVVVPLPSIEEQRKIAKILSTWDNAISTTEKLVSTSKQQKKALMQQLLTGKKRLVNPETGKAFEGEWLHGFLGDLCSFRGGSAFKEAYQGQTNGDYPFIKVSDMNLPKNGKFILQANNWVTEEVAKAIKAKPFSEGSIVFAKVGAALLLNRRRILAQPTILDNNMMAATPKNCCFTEFLYQMMLMIDFAKFVQDGAVPSVNQSDLSRFKISYPSIEEQQKIASALTTADKEVEVLEAKLAHFKQEKKALMQQLLTGKRRVKVEEMEVA